MANKTDFQVVDISMKITNQLPKVIITDELMVTVNNRKNNILNIQAMAQEFEKKKEDEMAFMTKGLEMLVGASATAKIEEMDLPLPEYKMLYETIMGVATGTYGEKQTHSR